MGLTIDIDRLIVRGAAALRRRGDSWRVSSSSADGGLRHTGIASVCRCPQSFSHAVVAEVVPPRARARFGPISGRVPDSLRRFYADCLPPENRCF